MGRSLVVLHARQHLLGATDDDSERSRDLVRHSRCQRHQRRHLAQTLQAAVALAGDLGDLQVARELELFALVAKRHAAEDEHEPAGQQDRENEPPSIAALAISFSQRAGHDGDAPGAQRPCIEPCEPGDRHALGQSQVRRLGTREAKHRAALLQRLQQHRLIDRPAVRRAPGRVVGALREQQ